MNMITMCLCLRKTHLCKKHDLKQGTFSEPVCNTDIYVRKDAPPSPFSIIDTHGKGRETVEEVCVSPEVCRLNKAITCVSSNNDTGGNDVTNREGSGNTDYVNRNSVCCN